ncbi:MAG: SPOR domain-containing protein, partial [Pseudomonadota bacterium]
DQDTFELEKELNLSAEEKESLLGDASPDGASPLHVPEATTEELLAKTLDELDQLHPVSEQPSSQRIPAFVVIGVLTLCAAAGSFFYLTSKQGPPPVIPVAQTNLAAKSAAAAPLRQKQEAENKPVMIPEAAQDNATRPAPSIPAEQQKPDSAKSAPSQPPSAERAKAEAGGLQPQEAKLLSPAAPAEKTHSVPGAEKKLAPIYAIHTDSYKTEETAIREINRLKKSGFDSYLQTADLKEKGVWQRVLTGKFSFPEEALKVQQELKKKYNKLDARIIAIEP